MIYFLLEMSYCNIENFFFRVEINYSHIEIFRCYIEKTCFYFYRKFSLFFFCVIIFITDFSGNNEHFYSSISFNLMVVKHFYLSSYSFYNHIATIGHNIKCNVFQCSFF